jgi:hypothetical protein
MVAGTTYAWTAHKKRMEQAEIKHAMHISWPFKLHGDHALFLPAGDLNVRTGEITRRESLFGK